MTTPEPREVVAPNVSAELARWRALLAHPCVTGACDHGTPSSGGECYDIAAAIRAARGVK